MKKAFTLVEMLLVAVIASIVLTVAIQLYQVMIKTKVSVAARQTLIKNSYYFLEKLNQQISNYTIDYEEYFNRAVVGCDTDGIGSDGSFERDVGRNGKCDRFTQYGNSFLNNPKWNLYYCSSANDIPTDEPNYVVYDINTSSWSGCWNPDVWTLHEPAASDFGGVERWAVPQPYWEYREQFWDYMGDADGISWVVFDDDDVDMGQWPKAIWDAENVRELYLISQDGTKRLFFRLARVGSWDWNNDGVISGATEKLYTVQILRLKGFDAGLDHDFSTTDDGAYDGKIDTWACDYSQWFVCNGNSVDTSTAGVYVNYHLPKDQDDGWVNFFGKSITITWFKMQIYPVKDPKYAWAEDASQISPYIRIAFKARLYGEPWQNKINPQILENFEISLQTTFTIRENY